MTSIGVPAPRVGSARTIRRTLFVERGRWQRAVFISALVGAAFWPLYENDSLWLGPGVALMVLIGWHALVTGRRLPWIPGLGLATAALQWVLAPWVTFHIGPIFPRFGMAVTAEQYFAFAVPALAALAAGMMWPLRREARKGAPVASATVLVGRRFRATCDAMIVVGLLTELVVAPLLGGGSLALVGALVSNLAFVGALALMLARVPGWSVRALAVLAVQALVSAASGMFHDLVLWTAYFGLTLIYAYRLKTRTILALVVAGMATIMVLNIAKRQFRESLETSQTGMFGSAAMLGTTMMENAADPDLAYEGGGFKANVTRLNQGWIISRVLYWVPGHEPFARGETIWATIRATLLPRVLDPGKLKLGGQTYFERFTGMPLIRTAMDLSVAGEMYVNFGYWGGLLGVFIFGAFLGAVYRVFLRWGHQSQLWWAWAPYVLLYSTRAENSLAEVTNLVFKSSVVMMAVIAVVPAWSMLRKPLRARVARVLRQSGPGAGVPRNAPVPRANTAASEGRLGSR